MRRAPASPTRPVQQIRMLSPPPRRHTTSFCATDRSSGTATNQARCRTLRDLGRVTSRGTSETLYNSTCDTWALPGASPVADVFGPVTALARGLPVAGRAWAERHGVVVKGVVRRG